MLPASQAFALSAFQANRLGLKIEVLQKEVAVVISNIKVHKDHAPSDEVLENK